MNAGFLGALTAIGWGGADFIARLSGRSIGHANALLGMLLSGAIFLSIYVFITDMPFVWIWSSAWLIGASGIGIMASTLLLYQALARGPVSVASPIVGSYPAFSVLFAVILGSYPAPEDWVAIGLILCGVLTVARYGPISNEPEHKDAAFNRKTVLISFLSAILFAISLLIGQLAAPIYGEVETTWLGRLVSLGCLLCLLTFSKSHTISLPLRWWPFLCAQGFLDSTAYICVFAAGNLPNAELAAVTASAFGAITVLLARFILKETVTLPQWVAMIAIFGGVGFLAL